jgi:hypothetical protein
VKIEQFRITNLRSIVDSGWCRLSPDDVTVLIGQNESGKTSVLEALWRTFSSEPLSEEQTRFNAPLPVTYLRVRASVSEVEKEMKRPLSSRERDAIAKFMRDPIELEFGWNDIGLQADPRYEGHCSLVDESLADQLKAAHAADLEDAERDANSDPAAITPRESPVAPKALDVAEVATALYRAGPQIEFFKQNIGLLPNTIDIGTDSKLTEKGATAARNYLTVANIDLQKLLTADARTRKNYLDRANDRVTNEFNKFWTQLIGRDNPLRLECELEYHRHDTAGKVAGQAYLTFWISDNLTRLYPRQRSEGVRWFVSFFLQLKATESSGVPRIFLLDEPGANLHSRAQEDVLKLIAELSKTIPIVYSTHSQDMLDFEKPFRIRAVQRDGDQEDSPTRIFEAEHLAAASSDTLSPILSAMGARLWRQQVIPRRANVLLEEISAFYYLKAFWKLTGSTVAVSFLAATGANKLPQLAFLFVGWGLEFGVVIDDDNRGRGVFNELKRDLFADDDTKARAHMLKISGCSGIEDIFTPGDFSKFICGDFNPSSHQAISAWLKSAGRSKPVLAYGFLKRVTDGELSLESLEPETKQRVTSLVQSIEQLQPVR